MSTDKPALPRRTPQTPPAVTTTWPRCTCGSVVCPDEKGKLGSDSAPLRFALYRAGLNKGLDQ